MEDPIKTILQFLDRCEAVEGRANQELPEELRQQIRRFAEGKCTPAERAEIVAQLARNRGLEDLLAEEVRNLRDAGDGGGNCDTGEEHA